MSVISDSVIKRANWLELLFDLIFVYAISKATHILAHAHNGHLSADQYITFILVMIPIWWAWTGHTLFATRFDTEDTIQRILTLVQMLAVIFWATFINADFDPNYLGYLIFYVLIRVLLIFMYWRACSSNPDALPITKRLSIGFSIGLGVALLSLLFDPPTRYFALYAGIGIEILTPLLSRKVLKKTPVNSHHLPERYGLLTIILLGESVIIIATTLSEIHWTASSVGATITGFVMLISIWWLYFDLMENQLIGKPLGTGQRIIYGHLFIYLGLSLFAVSIGFSILPDLVFIQHVVLLIIGLGLLSVGFLLIFSIKALANKEYLFLYSVFVIAIVVSLGFSINTPTLAYQH